MKKQRPEDVVKMLWKKNLEQTHGIPVNDSVFRDAIKEIQETRWERNLFALTTIVAMAAVCVLTFAYNS